MPDHGKELLGFEKQRIHDKEGLKSNSFSIFCWSENTAILCTHKWISFGWAHSLKSYEAANMQVKEKLISAIFLAKGPKSIDISSWSFIIHQEKYSFNKSLVIMEQ